MSPIDNEPALVHVMDWCQPADRHLSEPMIVSLQTHICVTRPQWVNGRLSEGLIAPLYIMGAVVTCLVLNHLHCRQGTLLTLLDIRYIIPSNINIFLFVLFSWLSWIVGQSYPSASIKVLLPVHDMSFYLVSSKRYLMFTIIYPRLNTDSYEIYRTSVIYNGVNTSIAQNNGCHFTTDSFKSISLINVVLGNPFVNMPVSVLVRA